MFQCEGKYRVLGCICYEINACIYVLRAWKMLLCFLGNHLLHSLSRLSCFNNGNNF
jgi:hypothetical protein